MRLNIWTGMCIAAFTVTTAAAVAQTSQPPQTPQTQPQTQPPTTSQTPPQTPPQTSGNDHRVTVTGCLRDATADSPTTSGTVGTTGTTDSTGTTGTAGTGTTANADAKFVLTDATNGSSATTTAASGHAYRLIANPTALSPHVGKKLELTGTVDESTPGAVTTTKAASPFASAPALHVESGKVVAATCEK